MTSASGHHRDGSPAPTQALVHQLVAVQDAERNRIYAGLHDDTVQVLAAVALQLLALRRRNLPADVLTEISDLGYELSSAGQRLRDLVVDLHPEDLERHGLRDALRFLAERVLDGHVTVTLAVADDVHRVPTLVARTLYEIAVEALRNVQRHARATAVEVDVHRSGGRWRLVVADDGVGMPLAEGCSSSTYGQQSMHQRAAAAGGTLVLRPTAGGGTTVTAEIPESVWFLDHPGSSDDRDRQDVRVAIDSILRHVSDAFLALDADWRFVYLNERAAEFFDRPADALLGRVIWTEFPEAVGHPFHAAYHRAMADQQSIQIEDYYPPWDRWYENRIIPSPQGLTVFFKDVSERHLMRTTVADTDLGVQIADVWFTHLAGHADPVRAVDAAAGAAVASGLLRGVVVRLDGEQIRRGDVTGPLDTHVLAVDDDELGDVALCWPRERDEWTAYLTAKVAQMISVRLARGAATSGA